MAREIDSIDSATIVIGKDTGKKNVRQVDTELMEIDKVFIQESITKGFSKDTTYTALTEHRLKNNRPRILKPIVDKEYDSIKISGKADLTCPISGTKADAILRIELIPRDGKIADAAMSICIPINKAALSDYHPNVATLDLRNFGGKNFDLLKNFPILKESFIGAKK